METEGEKATPGKTWTPEILIQAFKEIITAALGLLVVVYTVILASRAIGLVGKQQEMADAKDILLLMLGLAGVVVGYYFGRAPADARASQAQVRADEATARAGQVGAQAQVIADQVDAVMDRVVPAASAARGADAARLDAAVAADLQRIRDELRAMSILSRGR